MQKAKNIQGNLKEQVGGLTLTDMEICYKMIINLV